jgi:hypothetical protein
MGRKTALCAALVAALSGFAIGYSQEMRTYILKMFLVPLVSLAFLNLLKNMSAKNIILYLLLSVCNDIFHLHEMEMYDKMYAEHLDADNMLKIYFDYKYPWGDGGMIFKKYNPRR